MSKLFSTPKSKALLATFTSVFVFAIALSLFVWLMIVTPLLTLGLLIGIFGIFFTYQIYLKFLGDYEDEEYDEEYDEDYEENID